MKWIALKMLTGDRGKYYAIIFGIAFACMLMAQQASIFVGLMRNTISQLRDHVKDDAPQPEWRARAVSRSLNAARSRAELRVQRFLDAAFELLSHDQLSGDFLPKRRHFSASATPIARRRH